MASAIYPSFSLEHIQNPNRFYAVPVIGFVTKVLMLIPVFILMVVLSIGSWFALIINSFVVLFSGKYWVPAYELQLGVLRLYTKSVLFGSGLTDKYPGFDFNLPQGITLDIPMPTNPSKLFAIPLFGGLARIIMLIPFLIYMSVIQYGANIGVFASFFPVLFWGRYPESTYELARDSLRLTLSSSAYMGGLSDSYPSFWISMNHQTIKIILIILGAMWGIGNIFSKTDNTREQRRLRNRNLYNNSTTIDNSVKIYNNYNYRQD